MMKIPSTLSTLAFCAILSSCFPQATPKEELIVQEDKAPLEKVIETKVSIPAYEEKTHSFLSPYDNSELHYKLRKPSKEAKALLIFLVDENDPLPMLESEFFWQIQIPSRSKLNYQLIAEAEFWQMLDKAQEEEPQLKSLKHFLIAKANAADAALLFANYKRSHFQGLAFSKSRFGFQLPNLDALPIVHFKSEETDFKIPWANEAFIERLDARENLLVSKATDLTEAISALLEMSEEAKNL